MPTLETEVLDVIRRIFRTDLAYTGEVEPPLDLQRDLHVDSLNAVVLAVALEDHFRVRLATEDTVGVATVADLVARVAERVRASREGAPGGTA
ncbi:MAG: acyl carrier protein [Proteobacteria bacterium]|nr:acyl carrier protein [Pseudomonadota bacterium]